MFSNRRLTPPHVSNPNKLQQKRSEVRHSYKSKPSTLHDPSTISGSDIRTAKKTILEWFLGTCFLVVVGILAREVCAAKQWFVSGGGLCWGWLEKKVNTVVNAAVFFCQRIIYDYSDSWENGLLCIFIEQKAGLYLVCSGCEWECDGGV
jgi:hypothetical protein